MSDKNNSKNYLFSGVTELLILAVLTKEDSYVYDIAKEIEELSGGKILISKSTVYSVTYKLFEEGKISQYSELVGKRRTRMYCHLEERGKEYYLQLLNNFREVFSGAEQIIDALSDDKGDKDE